MSARVPLLLILLIIPLVLQACGGGAPGEDASPMVAATLTQRAIETAGEPVESTPTELPASPTATVTMPEPSATSTAAPTATPPPTETPLPPASTATPSPQPTPQPLARWLDWNGSQRYLVGVNLPWVSYGNDFGSNVWGAYGVHTQGTYEQVDAAFADMAAAGVNSVRWFVFGDGRAGIEYDERGFPLRLDPLVFDDMDAALEIATRHGILVDFVLLDFHFMLDAEYVDGVQLGGRSAAIRTPAGQAAVIDNLFVPLFDRFGSHPQVLSWEIMNEPEWAISDDGGDPVAEASDPATLEEFQTFVRAATQEIHARTEAYATVGGASMKWINDWTDVGLDYLQVHYYDWMAGLRDHDAYSRKYQALDTSLPIVVGEFPSENSETDDLDGYLATWFDNGFAGAWAWSVFGGGTSGAPDFTVVERWIQTNAAALAGSNANSP